MIGSALVQRLADVHAEGGARAAVLAAAAAMLGDIRAHVDAA